MRQFDQAAIIWTIAIVVAAIGFAGFNGSQNYTITDEIIQIEPESAEQEISRGGVAQQAVTSTAAKLAKSSTNQGLKEVYKIDAISLSTITQTVSPNAASVTHYFNPQGSMQNIVATLQQFGNVYDILYDKQSVCYAIIKPQPDLTPKKLYKCDGTFIHDVPANSKFFTFDTKGNLFYFIDAYDATDNIFKLTPDGTSSIFLNHYARGIAIDSQDNVYITDIGYQIHKYDKNGILITTWKGGEAAGWAMLQAGTDPSVTIPYYAEIKHTFSTQHGSISEEKMESHWYGHVYRFPGYANAPELTSPQTDCDPGAKLRDYDHIPTVSTRDDYDQSGDLKADQPTNHGVFLNTAIDPCVIIIFIHGYNNEPNEARDKYGHLRDRLLNLGTPELADNLILYTWDSDMGAAGSNSFHQSKSVAVSNGNALAAFVDNYRASHPTTKIFAISHSLGAELLISAMNKGAEFDRIDMIAPAIEAFHLNSVPYVNGGVYVHVNTRDGALESAKNLELVFNPLGLEGGPTTCNPEGIPTWNFGSIAIDSHDYIYVATPGLHSIFKIDSAGNYITGFRNMGQNGHEFTACALIVGNAHLQSANSLTSNGNKILIGQSTSPKFGFYYDYYPPTIPELKIYEVRGPILDDPNAEHFKPDAFDANLNELDASTPLSPKSCQTLSPKFGFIIAKCTYEDSSGNKLYYVFPKKIVELRPSFDTKTSLYKESTVVKKLP